MDLSTPVVMGVINVTPDSFSDGSNLGSTHKGLFKVSIDKAVKLAEEMQAAGAMLVDVGGESTRPGAEPVSIQQELDRVIPVIESISDKLAIHISVDTSSAEVMREACGAGAVMINDIRALTQESALSAARDSGAAVCLMHTLAEPAIMQQDIHYGDLVEDVYSFLKDRVEQTITAGIARDKLVIDPGFGFGKSVQHNYRLLRELTRFQELGLPILVGISRKSMIGHVVERPTDQRLAGSLAAATYALANGASIIRAHDVAATLDVIKVHCALINA